MKRMRFICVTLLVLTTLLCGCTGRPEPTDPTNTSENTLPTGQTQQVVL